MIILCAVDALIPNDGETAGLFVVVLGMATAPLLSRIAKSAP
ncbi:MAG TPA: hypothetical protein VN982_03950 [Candidatus Dormibacteraeota bacterium]|nr:hypothetical protein [Candidatus Dormibacteraeota bacterium]